MIKKLLLAASLWILWLSFVHAQNSDPLAKLYPTLDNLIEEKTAIIPVLITKLDSYQKAYEPSSTLYAIIESIEEYLQVGYDAKMTALEPVFTLPTGYGQLEQWLISQFVDAFHMRGSTDAPIVVVEFVDFQCPYCRRQHTDGILDTLREELHKGSVRTSVGMFPLQWDYHKLAQQAAESAECAFIQWGLDIFYNHKAQLFATSWLQPTMTRIKAIAESNGLDPLRMEACINEWHATDEVATQKNRWRRLWVNWTPNTVVLDTRTGAYTMIKWAQWIASFSTAINALQNSVVYTE